LQKQREQLVTIADPRSPVSEAYRALRTNIQFSSLDTPLRTLLITSTGPDEGKSTSLANLGVTFALAGVRVILVDCDLRRPNLHDIFDIDNSRGLTSLFIEEERVLDFEDKAIFKETAVANLKVLPSGQTPPNPSELLGSMRMSRIIESLKATADLVLFDSPPILAVTDAAILSRKLDGVLLVISAGQTKRDRAIKAKAMLEKANARVIGVVLNNARVDTSAYSY
jgi:non-specific protein-tyrosine kinase